MSHSRTKYQLAMERLKKSQATLSFTRRENRELLYKIKQLELELFALKHPSFIETGIAPILESGLDFDFMNELRQV